MEQLESKNISESQDEQMKTLHEIANELDPGRKTKESVMDGITMLELKFDGSTEGIGLCIEKRSFIREDLDGYIFVINPWVYDNMEELDEMEEITEKALDLLPDAILCFADDPFDYNPSSAAPSHRYYSKASDSLSYKSHFEGARNDN